MKLIKNEIKKIILSRKYIVAMSIFFALYACMSVLMCKDTINSKPEIALSKNQKNLEYWQKQKEDKNISKKRESEIDQNIKFIERRNKDLKFQIENKNVDWEKDLKKIIII
ncbi:hypothetical protein JTS98_10045 [Clostridium botulinum]|nr:hypothetical protein [Clostridium botulinum]